MNYVNSLNLFGVEAKEIPCITGSGAPTTSTVGAVGLLYMNTDNGDMYKCTSVSGNIYTWKPVGSGSSDSGGNVDLYIGPDKPTNGAIYWLDTSEDIPVVPDEPVIPDVPDVPDEPEKALTSISATYSGGAVEVGTAVADLTGIVVTAHYSDGTSEAVTGYTLSGTIEEGSNTVTVSYGGKTAAFTVTGVAESTGGGVDVSEGNVYTSVAASGEAKIAINNDTLQGIAVDTLYAYMFVSSAYQKKFRIRARFTSSSGVYNIVNDITPANANAGTSEIVPQAYDHYSDGGYLIYKINVAELKAEMQELISAGTIDVTKGTPQVEFVVPMALSGSTFYLLYNYTE